MSQALNRLRAMVSPPKYSPPMPRLPTGDRGWMAWSGADKPALFQEPARLSFMPHQNPAQFAAAPRPAGGKQEG
jgi:hypothetical protein